MAHPEVVLLGHIVELDPGAVFTVHNTLSPQDLTVLAGVQSGQDALNIGLGKRLGRLLTPGGEHLVGVVMVMMVAGTVGIVAFVFIVMMLMVMVVMMLMLILVIIVMVMARAVGIVALLLIMVMMMVLLLLVVMMVVGVLGFFSLVLLPHLRQQLVGQGHLFHS